MMRTKVANVKQDSCLRGGANLASILDRGNGMASKFSRRPESINNEDGGYDVGASTVEQLVQESTAWDYLVMNDYTQGPVRSDRKQKSMEALQNRYIPMITNSNNPSPTIIFVQTAAYKSPVKNSGDLGSFEEFTEKLVQGYNDYADLVRTGSGGKINAKVAPFGLAHKHIKENYGDALWERLYHWDDFHPSPSGTYLEASVLYCTILGERPPDQYNSSWWDDARYFPNSVRPFPSAEDAKKLRDAAWEVCKQS